MYGAVFSSDDEERKDDDDFGGGGGGFGNTHPYSSCCNPYMYRYHPYTIVGQLDKL